MFWHKFFSKTDRTFWCDWPETYDLTWQQSQYLSAQRLDLDPVEVGYGPPGEV
jgi:hypothetical protein